MAKRKSPSERAARILAEENEDVEVGRARGLAALPGVILGPNITKPLAVGAALSALIGGTVAKRKLKKAEDTITETLPKIATAKAKNATLRARKEK
jgi:uncharacterized membrane protein YczE